MMTHHCCLKLCLVAIDEDRSRLFAFPLSPLSISLFALRPSIFRELSLPFSSPPPSRFMGSVFQNRVSLYENRGRFLGGSALRFL
jgi:hypothetical protein